MCVPPLLVEERRILIANDVEYNAQFKYHVSILHTHTRAHTHAHTHAHTNPYTEECCDHVKVQHYHLSTPQLVRTVSKSCQYLFLDPCNLTGTYVRERDILGTVY